MKVYSFEIKETLIKRVTISADNIAEARRLVNKKYRESKIVLTADDFVDVDIQYIDTNVSKFNQGDMVIWNNSPIPTIFKFKVVLAVKEDDGWHYHIESDEFDAIPYVREEELVKL